MRQRPGGHLRQRGLGACDPVVTTGGFSRPRPRGCASSPQHAAHAAYAPLCQTFGWTQLTLQIWDLGGQREFVSMLPLVSNDAVAILFMFDLTRKATLNSVKEWYRQARGFNKVSRTVLYGSLEAGWQ